MLMTDNFKIPISGDEFEILNINLYYEEHKNDAIIEPNLRFFRTITPSVVDFDAEIDLFAQTKNDTIHIFEYKARDVSQYDISKFYILLEDIGLTASKQKIVSADEPKGDVKKLMADHDIEFERYNFMSIIEAAFIEENIPFDQNNLNRNSKRVRAIIENYLSEVSNKNLEMEILRKYSTAALFEHPAYFILLNDCWKQSYSINRDIFFAIKKTLKAAIPKADKRDRVILEFIFIKACLLEKWLVEKERRVCTRDLIKILIDSNYDSDIEEGKEIDWIKERNENLLLFRNHLEIELGNNLTINEKEDNLQCKKYKASYYNEFSLGKIKTLYAVIGMDRFILTNLTEGILDLYQNQLSFNDLKLYHTIEQGSIDAANILKDMINKKIKEINQKREQTPKISMNIEVIDYRNSENEKFNPWGFIESINKLANKDAALLVTYVPKEWTLYFNALKHRWLYFFVIDRPEFSDPLISLRIYYFANNL